MNKKKIKFTKQEDFFIQRIEKAYNITRKEAEKFYMNYLHKSSRARRKIRGNINDKLGDGSP